MAVFQRLCVPIAGIGVYHYRYLRVTYPLWKVNSLGVNVGLQAYEF